MPQLTVRNVPEDMVEALREEAAEGGTSMNAVVRDALRAHIEQREWRKRAEHAIPAMEELRARIAEEAGGTLSSSVPIIREFRERL